MAISTYKIFLMQKNVSAWEKLIDIKEFPDLGGAPEMLETTTLSDKMQTYIPGIQSLDSLEFTANYTLDEYKKLKVLEGTEKEFAVWFGGTEAGDTVTPTGNSGKFKFNVPANYRVEKSQLPLFQHEPSRICNRNNWWLRDVITASGFAFVDSGGYATYNNASYSLGVRPAFCIS